MAAAKARGKTLDEYLAGASIGSARAMHIHEELAFDALDGLMSVVDPGQGPQLPKREREETHAAVGKPAGME